MTADALLRGALIGVVSATHVAALGWVGAHRASAPPVPALIELDVSLAPPAGAASPPPAQPAVTMPPLPDPLPLPVADPPDMPPPPVPAPVDLAALEPRFEPDARSDAAPPLSAPRPTRDLEPGPERIVDTIAPTAPRVPPPPAAPRRIERREPTRLERARETPQARTRTAASTPSAPRENAGTDRAAAARAYASLVLGAIRSRVVYPAGASGSGIAMIAFTVGSSGRVASASLSRSTGQGALDAAALSAVRGISVPPPPGGSFSAVAPIRFNAR